MAWTTPLTAVATASLTAAQWNASVRDNLLETAVAKASAAGQIFAATGANSLAARTPSTAAVSSADTTTSVTYTATLTSNSGPTISSLTTGTSAFVMVNARQSNSTGSAECYTSFAISGATTLAASDTFALFFQPDTAGRNNRASAGLIVTGMVAGSNTFTSNYRVSAGTGTFSNRQIVAIPF